MNKIYQITMFCIFFLISCNALNQIVSPNFTAKIGDEPIENMRFNKSRNYLVFNTSNKIICWNTSLKKIEKELVHKFEVKKFSLDKEYRYLFSNDGTLHIWSIADATKIKEFGDKFYSDPACEISPDGRFVVYSSGNLIKLKSMVEEKNHTLKGNSQQISLLKFNHTGEILASCPKDKSIVLWNIQTQKIVEIIREFDGYITKLLFSYDGKYLISGFSDGTIRIWSIDNPSQSKNSTPGFNQEITGLAQIGDNTILSSDNYGNIKAWDLVNLKEIDSFTIPSKIITSINFNTNTEELLVGSRSGDLLVYDITRILKIPESMLVRTNPLLYSKSLEYISNYVEQAINSWQKRGKFEKSEDYLSRVNTVNRDKKIEDYTKEAINNMGLERLDFSTALYEYDPDNEFFKITFKSFEPLFLPVPLDEAPTFDENINNLSFIDPAFSFFNKKLVLHSIIIKNKGNNKQYVYNSNTPVIFNKNDYNLTFDEIEVTLPDKDVTNKPAYRQKTYNIGISDVDKDIPENQETDKTHIYALIVGNEDYTTYQTNLGSEVTVDYAENDAEIVSQYLEKTFGIPKKNITLLKNATYAQMMRAINKMEIISEISDGEGELIFYYSGHGLPDEETKEAFIMPVDASATTLESAIKLNEILSKLTTYPSVKVLAIIDACFSGGGRNKGLLAMKSVKIKPSAPSLKGNLVVLSSSTGEESSGVYREKQHGMFTYYLLKKLKETAGDISMKELADYIQDQVELESVIINNKRQTPQVLYSPDVEGIWEKWRLVE